MSDSKDMNESKDLKAAMRIRVPISGLIGFVENDSRCLESASKKFYSIGPGHSKVASA